MKIIIVHNRYFVSGSPEKDMFIITHMLERDGITVIPFSVKRVWNLKSKYEKYFITPIYGENTLYFNDAVNLTPFQKLKIFANCIYSFEAKSKMAQLLDNEEVDLVYILGIMNDISPSIIDTCKKRNIPVVIRLLDYNLMCGNYVFLRKNNICKLCITRGPFQCTKYRCVKNKFLPSIARSAAMFVHNFLKIYDYVDAFICPCNFLKDALLEAGYPAHKLYRINNFISPKDYTPYYENDGYALYMGRISYEKGLEYLLQAKKYLSSSIPLYIAGKTNDQTYLSSLENYISENKITDVKFLGFKTGKDLEAVIKKSKFIVVPSIWPDNSPVSSLEAMAFGKPLIASDIGGISDQIQDNQTGFLVPPKDPKAIAEKMEILWNNDSLVQEMGKKARLYVEKSFSSEEHYAKLTAIFNTYARIKK